MTSPCTCASPAPDWRYRRARELFAAGRAAARDDDAWIRLLLRFLQARSATAYASARLPAQILAIASAVALRESCSPLLRWIEALLLAGASPARIAQRCGLEEETVVAFRHCCFDVADRRSQPDYILEIVILNDAARSGASVVDAAVKFLGYLQGPDRLETLLPAPHGEGGAAAGFDSALGSAEDALVDAMRFVSLLRAPLAGGGIAGEMLAQSIRRRAAEPRAAPYGNYEQNVQAMLESLHFGKWRAGQEKPPSGEQSPFELRWDEELAVQFGFDAPLLKALSNGEFPPPAAEDGGQEDAGKGGAPQ